MCEKINDKRLYYANNSIAELTGNLNHSIRKFHELI
jgi:hypothetical protein